MYNQTSRHIDAKRCSHFVCFLFRLGSRLCLHECSCGPKSKTADKEKEDSKDADDKDEEHKLEEAVWEAKLKFLQVTLHS